MKSMILKYAVSNHTRTITIPSDAEIVSVNKQAGELCVWAEVKVGVQNGDNHREVIISPVTTGQEFNSDTTKYIGTIFDSRDGYLPGQDADVTHIYATELTEVPARNPDPDYAAFDKRIRQGLLSGDYSFTDFDRMYVQWSSFPTDEVVQEMQDNRVHCWLKALNKNTAIEESVNSLVESMWKKAEEKDQLDWELW